MPTFCVEKVVVGSVLDTGYRLLVRKDVEGFVGSFYILLLNHYIPFRTFVEVTFEMKQSLMSGDDHELSKDMVIVPMFNLVKDLLVDEKLLEAVVVNGAGELDVVDGEDVGGVGHPASGRRARR